MVAGSLGPNTSCLSNSESSVLTQSFHDPALAQSQPKPVQPMTRSLNTPTKHGVIAKTIFALLAINSLFLMANGLFMLADPRKWFFMIPGVKFTGGFNQHFIRDIGLIQLFLGAAFVVGMLRPTIRLELWAAATLWLVAHSLFHFWEVAVGICGPSVLARDFPDVTLPAIIGAVLTFWAIAEGRTAESRTFALQRESR